MRCLKGLAWVFQGCCMGVSRVLEGSHKDVNGVLHRHSKGVTNVTNVIKECYKGVKRVLQWRYFVFVYFVLKRVFQWCFIDVSMKL